MLYVSVPNVFAVNHLILLTRWLHLIQVVVAATLRKGLSAITGIVVQMQGKLGGRVWAVSVPPNLDVMVCGMDVYHEKHRPSVATLICSYDRDLTLYSGQCCFLERGKDIVTELTGMMRTCLQHYHTVNHALPCRVVMYGDGVGHGNHEYVLDTEVLQMRQAFASFGGEYKPELVVITVNKRIHLRFWMNGGRKPENPPSGTVITDHVTQPWCRSLCVRVQPRPRTTPSCSRNGNCRRS